MYEYRYLLRHESYNSLSKCFFNVQRSHTEVITLCTGLHRLDVSVYVYSSHDPLADEYPRALTRP